MFGVFLQFQAFVQKKFNSNIKVCQSDGGGEYISPQFQSLLKKKKKEDIIHKKSCQHQLKMV